MILLIFANTPQLVLFLAYPSRQPSDHRHGYLQRLVGVGHNPERRQIELSMNDHEFLRFYSLASYPAPVVHVTACYVCGRPSSPDRSEPRPGRPSDGAVPGATVGSQKFGRDEVTVWHQRDGTPAEEGAEVLLTYSNLVNPEPRMRAWNFIIHRTARKYNNLCLDEDITVSQTSHPTLICRPDRFIRRIKAAPVVVQIHFGRHSDT